MNRSVLARAPWRVIPGREAVRSAESTRTAVHAPAYPLQPVLVGGFLSLCAWAAVYVLFFSHTLWHSPSLIPDHWPQIFYPLQSLFPWSWVHAHRDVPAGWPNIAAWLVLAAVLGLAWLWALRAATRLPAGDRWLEREGGRIVIAGLACFSALLVFSPGFTSQDLFSNIFYAKMAGVYHVSPYLYYPSFFSYQDSQHWLQWVFWKDQPCVYGPAWVWPATVLTWLAQAIDGDIVTYLLTQRIGAAVVNIANAVLIWHLAGRLFPGKPGARLAATLFYAWCPLIIWEFANNAHNDVLVVFWVLVAIWAHLQGEARASRVGAVSSRWFGGLGAWWLVALGALMLAGLTKAIGFVLIPAYLMLLYRAVSGHRHPWRQRVLVSLSGAALGLALLGVLYQPFWDGVSTLKVLLTAPGEKFYVNSLGFVLRYRTPEIIHKIAAHFGETGLAWDIGTIGSSMEKWIRNLAEAVAGLIGLILTLRVRDFPSLLRSWAWTLVAYVLIAAMWFWPWYLGWIIPLAALAGPGRLRRTLVLYSAGGMALYGLAPLIPPPIAGWEGYVPLICFGPVALYLTGCTLRDVRERFRRPSRVAQAESTPDGLPAPLAALGRLLGVRRPVPVPAEWAERPPSARD